MLLPGPPGRAPSPQQATACPPVQVVVAGGMESMSNVPYYAPAMRKGAGGRGGLQPPWPGRGELAPRGPGARRRACPCAAGARMGHATLVDGMLRDGLWDPHHDIHMGECAELCAER